MAEFVKVGSTSDLNPGQCMIAEANDKMIALYNVDGTIYATDNTCLHQGGPLGEGALDGTTIICPWHAWEWDVTNGQSVFNPRMSIATYPVKVEGESVMVQV